MIKTGLTGFAEGFGNVIGSISNSLIFWKNWDNTSIYLLFGIFGFAILTYVLIKRNSIDSNNIRNNKLTNKRRSFR